MKKILDIWCWGWNNKYKIYNKNYKTYWVDIDINNVNTCRNKFPDSIFQLVKPWDKLPFDNNYFDTLHSLDTLEHVDDLKQILEESTRVLKKWWKFIIEIPYWKSEQFLLKIKPEYWEQVHHVRMFKEWELENIMNNFWYELIKKKKLNFFENIVLYFQFKKWDIISQKWDSNVKIPYFIKLLKYCTDKESTFRNTKTSLILWPVFLIIYPIRIILNRVFPKSISFNFIKK